MWLLSFFLDAEVTNCHFWSVVLADVMEARFFFSLSSLSRLSLSNVCFQLMLRRMRFETSGPEPSLHEHLSFDLYVPYQRLCSEVQWLCQNKRVTSISLTSVAPHW